MTRRELYLAIILAVLALVGLYVWFGWGSNGEKTTTKSETSVAASEQRIEKLRRLKGIQLDTAVLSDPRFGSLKSREEMITAPTQVPDVKPGRANPFLPF